MTDNRLKIIFMGTPDFAARALQKLIDTQHEVVCVYTQPPRPKGRGQHVQPSPVQLYAESKNIPVFHPQSLKKPEEQETFASHKADIAIVAAYGLILPKSVLKAPRYGCLNIHASLLPRWRGASPIQRSIWAGDSESGVTIMQMDEGLDTGAMVARQAVPITPQTTSPYLHDRLADLGAEMAVQTLKDLARTGKISSTPQDNTYATYAPLLTKEDGRINWSQTTEEIDRQIRALNPWPGVWTTFNNKRIKILEAQIALTQTGDVQGSILDKQGHIACGENTTLQITKLQPEGKNPMDFASALNGHYIEIGKTFQ